MCVDHVYYYYYYKITALYNEMNIVYNILRVCTNIVIGSRQPKPKSPLKIMILFVIKTTQFFKLFQCFEMFILYEYVCMFVILFYKNA